MFSIADMAVAGAVALLLFGPDQLPKVARRAGQLVRDVQNTSQSFIREMERAADDHDHDHHAHSRASETAAVPATLSSAPAYHETPEPAPHELVAMEAALEPHSHPPAHDEAVGAGLREAEAAGRDVSGVASGALESPHSAPGQAPP